MCLQDEEEGASGPADRASNFVQPTSQIWKPTLLDRRDLPGEKKLSENLIDLNTNLTRAPIHQALPGQVSTNVSRPHPANASTPIQGHRPIASVYPSNAEHSDVGLTPTHSQGQTQVINTAPETAGVPYDDRNNFFPRVDRAGYSTFGFNFPGHTSQRMPFMQNPTISVDNEQQGLDVHSRQAQMSPTGSTPAHYPSEVTNDESSLSSRTYTASFISEGPSTHTSGYTTDHLSDLVRSGIHYGNIGSSTPSHISNCSPNVSSISASAIQTTNETTGHNSCTGIELHTQYNNISQSPISSRTSPYGIMQPTNAQICSPSLSTINTPPLGLDPHSYPLDSEGEITCRVNPNALYQENDLSAHNHQNSFAGNTNLVEHQSQEPQSTCFQQNMNPQTHAGAQEYSTPFQPYENDLNKSSFSSEFSATKDNCQAPKDQSKNSVNLHDMGQLQSNYEDNLNQEYLLNASVNRQSQPYESINMSIDHGLVPSQSVRPSNMLIDYESLQEPDTFDLEHLRNRLHEDHQEITNSISTQTEPSEALETGPTGNTGEQGENENRQTNDDKDMTEQKNAISDNESDSYSGLQGQNNCPTTPASSDNGSKQCKNGDTSKKSGTKKTPVAKKSTSAKKSPAGKKSGTEKETHTPVQTTPITRAKKRQALSQEGADVEQDEDVEEGEKGKSPQSFRNRIKYFLRPTPAKGAKSDK